MIAVGELMDDGEGGRVGADHDVALVNAALGEPGGELPSEAVGREPAEEADRHAEAGQARPRC